MTKNAHGVFDDPEGLRHIPDGTIVNLRYQTARSNYQNDKGVSGAVEVRKNFVKVGVHKVYTQTVLEQNRQRGAVVTTHPKKRVGVFYRAEIEEDIHQ
jgi:hypothetical protein